jgi:aminodeoxyfutalosine synthase
VTINLAIVERAKAGEALTAAELDELAAADVLSLGMLADEVRRARVGDTVTYTQDAESRLTMLPATLADAAARVREAKASQGPVVGYSLAEVIDRNWGPLADVLKELKSAGLDAIAEAPVDRIGDLAAALRAAQDAGLAVRCLSLQRPITGGRTDFLLQLRALASQFPAIHTVAPLPREQSIAVPTTGYDDVRAVALARLALPSVKNIQVDWAQYGPKLAQVALTFGANDLDRVSTVDDPALGKRRTAVEDVRRNIAAAGFTAIERSFDSERGETPPLAQD